ncbi:MAG: hypothetical protein AAFP04_14905 [Myxococcota bacterium]
MWRFRLRQDPMASFEEFEDSLYSESRSMDMLGRLPTVGTNGTFRRGRGAHLPASKQEPLRFPATHFASGWRSAPVDLKEK